MALNPGPMKKSWVLGIPSSSRKDHSKDDMLPKDPSTQKLGLGFRVGTWDLGNSKIIGCLEPRTHNPEHSGDLQQQPSHA